MVTQLVRHAGFNGPHRTDFRAGHAVPAITRLPAVSLLVFAKSHEISRADLFTECFFFSFAAVTFFLIDSWWHVDFLLLVREFGVQVSVFRFQDCRWPAAANLIEKETFSLLIDFIPKFDVGRSMFDVRRSCSSYKPGRLLKPET
jgi:hypothetical protein